MTRLIRPVRRESHTPADWRGRPIIVYLEPGDVLGFREKGRRKIFRLTIKTCFLMAVRAQVEAERRDRIKARKQKTKRICK